MEKQKSSKSELIILVLILVIQACFLCYFGDLKAGYHEDEMATFTLANYPDGFISRTEELMNTWTDGSVWLDVLTVSGEERFNYEMVYANQESDVHPPLYYYVIHTISSIFEGQFSKWIGIVPNVTSCLLISVLLYLIAKKLMKSKWMAFVVVIGWAFSVGAVDIATFIRMYAMLTLFTVLLIFLHLKAYEQIESDKQISLAVLGNMFLCTFGGLLTHYYFAVFSMFFCGLFLFFLIFNKRWKDIEFYILAEFGAITISFVHYPAMIEHILGSGMRGMEAFNNLKNVNDWGNNAKEVFEIIDNDLFSGWGKYLLVLSVVSVLIGITRNKVIMFTENLLSKKLSKEPGIVTFFILVLLGYCFLIAKIAPFRENRYYMCIYPLFILCAVYVLYKCCESLVLKERISSTIISICVIILISGGIATQTPSYLYSTNITSRNKQLQQYNELPIVVINGTYDWYPSRWILEYVEFDKIYIGGYEQNLEILELAMGSNDISEGFLLYVLRGSESDEEIYKKIEENVRAVTIKKLCDGDDRIFVCMMEE